MPPINDGFIVIGRYIETFNDIISNRRYVLVTVNEGIVFKRVNKNAIFQSKLFLHSDNLSYSPYSIEKEEILEIWSFYSFIGYPDHYKSHVIYDIFNKLEVIYNKIEDLGNN